MAQAIFFEDFTGNAQERLIREELEDIVQGKFVIRYIETDKDLYGYDPDPKKQTVEQHVYAMIFVDGPHPEKWFLEWNCMEHEFTTVMKEDQK